ncbi:hypothetical protein [Agrococcus terreus]|uniref:Uncharacterized protein n=1 Tax=Agrococcus terreus TaxID=574649 RepID=A0ABQ2KP53_9MICO|nr:hypothetical protein [Agrococcus terreus]GGN89229.1 hypothetical protein GCM10010968_25670 [Agrococcus terreus]
MSGQWRPSPHPFWWLLAAIIALVFLLTGTVLPRTISATLFVIAAFGWFRSGSVEAPREGGGADAREG